MDVYEAGAALCAPFLQDLPVAGVSVSVVVDGGVQSTVGTSDAIAARLDELQFQLGEGPTADVLRSGDPLLVPDMTASSAALRWPMFSASAVDAGARGVFSFPLLLRAIRVGVVSLYSPVVVPDWSAADLHRVAALTRATVRPAIALATRSAAAEVRPSRPGQAELRREVHQASGMVMVQLRCSVQEAMARLRAYAFAEGRPIDEVARDVVARSLHFADLPE